MCPSSFSLFFFNDTATTEIYTLSLHDALPISEHPAQAQPGGIRTGEQHQHPPRTGSRRLRSEEHTSELQSHLNLVCRLLLEKKKNTNLYYYLIFKLYFYSVVSSVASTHCFANQ